MKIMLRQSSVPSYIRLSEALEGKTVTKVTSHRVTSICAGADVTSFGKEITVRLAGGSGVAFQ